MTVEIVSDPEIMGGQWCFKGTRLPVRMFKGIAEEDRAWYREGWPQVTDEMIAAADAWTFPAIQEPEIDVNAGFAACACGEYLDFEPYGRETACRGCGSRWRVTIEKVEGVE